MTNERPASISVNDWKDKDVAISRLLEQLRENRKWIDNSKNAWQAIKAALGVPEDASDQDLLDAAKWHIRPWPLPDAKKLGEIIGRVTERYLRGVGAEAIDQAVAAALHRFRQQEENQWHDLYVSASERSRMLEAENNGLRKAIRKLGAKP